MLQCSFKSITVPKCGNSEKENEDSLLTPADVYEPVLKFAVADGATETSFSREWSKILVDFYNEYPFEEEHFNTTVQKAAQDWTSLNTAVELPWYAKQKLEIGAFAAFLGVTIDMVSHSYCAAAIGDSTLFHIRNNALHHSFPIQHPDEFDNTPFLLSSNPEYRSRISAHVQYFSKEILPGDMIVLATDALALWILMKAETGEQPWNSLFCLSNYEYHPTDFQCWLNNKRNEGEIKNDDLTLIIINFI